MSFSNEFKRGFEYGASTVGLRANVAGYIAAQRFKKFIKSIIQMILFAIVILLLCLMNGCSSTSGKLGEIRKGDVIQIEYFQKNFEDINEELFADILSNYDRSKYVIKIRFWNKQVKIIPLDNGGIYIQNVTSDIKPSAIYVFEKTLERAEK